MTDSKMPNELTSFEFETVDMNGQGSITDSRTLQAELFIEDLGSPTYLEMVKIPGGRFMMGSPKGELGHRDSESPQHLVIVDDFFLGKYPVTQGQWFEVMKKLPATDEEFRGSDLPVVNVWLELAMEFCSELSKITEKNYRLPTEAEWEYACRAGTTTPFNCGETITSDLVNFNGNEPYRPPPTEFRQKTTPIGYFSAANSFGLHDMHGNVWEWCADMWHADYANAPTDGRAWLEGGDQGYCVQRGGSWLDRAGNCRSAFRVGDIAHNSSHVVGLRVCLSM